MIFKPMLLKEAKELYDQISASCITGSFKTDLQEDIIFFTSNFSTDYGTPQKQLKYYVEISHCEDTSDYAIQSKWFDTYKQAVDWYTYDIDFLGENYNAYILHT